MVPQNECECEWAISEDVTVDRVNKNKYLGTVLDNKLTFECNTKNIVKQFNHRMFCMFRLRYFGVSSKTLSCVLVWYFECEENRQVEQYC